MGRTKRKIETDTPFSSQENITDNLGTQKFLVHVYPKYLNLITPGE
jgi:hypothetical protein